MKQETRLILAVVLSVGIFAGWSILFPQPTPPNTIQPEVATTETPSENSVTSSTVADNTTPTEAKPSAELPVSFAETKAEPKLLTLITPKAKIALDTTGAKLTQFELENFRKEADQNSELKDLLKETPNSSALALGIKGYPRFNQNKVFEVLENSDNKIVLGWKDDKISIKKTFTLLTEKSSYAVKAKVDIQNVSDEPRTVTPYWQNQVTQKEGEEPSGFMAFFSGGAAQADKYSPLYYKDESTESYLEWKSFETQNDFASWSAITDRYFMMAIKAFPLESADNKIEYTKKDNALIQKVFAKETTLQPRETVSSEILSYIGPKQTAELETLGANFEAAIDYGWFGFLAHPILWLMQTIHSLIPSWGLAIILLTFIVKLILYPINKKSMTSMKSMQQLQPKLKDIREKYADDKQKQNEEVMQLFRTHKVNPLGGCLPMLLQLPIYFALYRVLWNAIELYHTPFLHYKDLSAPDPYFIAPIIMGVFMVLQQRLTPNPSTDPSQKKMMMIMPVFFTMIMLFLPVGLVIYICINTLMSVIQQYMMHKDISLRDLILRRGAKTTA